MIYAIRTTDLGRRTLVEFASVEAMSSAMANIAVSGHGVSIQLLDSEAAYRWVKDGKEHETGLWMDDAGIIRYADAEIANAEADRIAMLEEALKLIAHGSDCGCSPVCQCNSHESVQIERDWMKEIASEALRYSTR